MHFNEDRTKKKRGKFTFFLKWAITQAYCLKCARETTVKHI